MQKSARLRFVLSEGEQVVIDVGETVDLQEGVEMTVTGGFASGEFYAEPDPVVPLPRSGRMWHWGKVLFERYWLGEGVVREAARLGLNLDGKVLGIPSAL